MTNKVKHGLGKGLGALIPSVEFDKEKGFSIHKDEDENLDKVGVVVQVDIDKIRKNPYQPRTEFEPEALEDLKNSIKVHGLITPISVRRSINGYELVSGERRLRAFTELGIKQVPAYILDVNTNAQMLELALIENVQRENLNPVEVAYGYQRLIDEFSYTQEKLAEKLGKERSTVANFLRLLKLPEYIHDLIRSKKISTGHARALITLQDHSLMISVVKEIVEKELSVRETEKLVKNYETKTNKPTTNPKPTNQIPENIKIVLNDYSDKLTRSFGTKVKISPKSKESGTIEFEFYSPDDLERLLNLFNQVVIE